MNSDLGAAACLTRNRLDLDDAFLYLGHLEFEQLFEKSRVRAREHDLRTAGRAFDLNDIRTNGIAIVVCLAGYLLGRHQHSLCFADIDIDAASLNALNNPRHDIGGTIHIRFVDNAAFRFAQTLHDHLFRGLRCNAPKVCRSHLDLDHIADLIVRIDGMRLCKRDVCDAALGFLDHRLDGKDVECARLA